MNTLINPALPDHDGSVSKISEVMDTGNPLIIPALPAHDGSVSKISEVMDMVKKNPVSYSPWPEYSYAPLVDFAVAHSGNSIFLKFFVTEKNVQALNLATNGPVCNDSCVEFFISWGKDQSYYNLEFNCSGTCHFGYGPDRNHRKLIKKELIDRVRYQTVFKTISQTQQYLVNWELTVAIPLEVFSYHDLKSISGQTCRVNFYKCGDLLPEPHYLSWTNMESAQPDFHQPQFFGSACFAD
ncbi:hypothetical protein GZH53_01765 [Flavihumibacter sp. R14]|nr:hypothetical protein [Flavihumibacter soli]